MVDLFITFLVWNSKQSAVLNFVVKHLPFMNEKEYPWIVGFWVAVSFFLYELTSAVACWLSRSTMREISDSLKSKRSTTCRLSSKYSADTVGGVNPGNYKSSGIIGMLNFYLDWTRRRGEHSRRSRNSDQQIQTIPNQCISSMKLIGQLTEKV